MAYDTNELKEMALKAIKKHNLFMIEDVVAFMPISKPTFYAHKLNELDELKDLINTNRINTKKKLQNKWAESDNATLQMGLMKIIASIEERQRLSQSYMDITSKGESLKYTPEEREQRIKELLDERNGNVE